MIPGRRAPVTRSNLVRVRRRLEQVEKGAALLHKKREALVRELFGRLRPMIDARRAIEQRALAAYRALHAALAERSRAELAALGWPSREVRVELAEFALWGVRAAVVARVPRLVRGYAARGAAPGHGDAAAQAAGAQFERLVELLLEAAPDDFALRRMGEALSSTTRLVNTLEQRVAAGLTAERLRMRRTLDEREREERTRLRRVAAGLAALRRGR
jgi:H(+)-transporting ATP synthase subunit D